MAASPIDCIFTMPRATARSTAYLQGGRAQGAVPPCKYEVNLFCGRPRAPRSQDGTFSPPWRLLGCPKRPQEKVLKIRGGHENGRKLDSLHFYKVPWPPRSGRQKHLRPSECLFRKSFENQRVLRRGSPARILAFLQGAVATSIEGKTRPKNSF